MFGNNFKYVLALGFLATFVYTSPAVLDSISSGIASTNQQAAVWDSLFNFGSTTDIKPAMRPDFASSTRPVGNGGQNNQGQGDHRLNPQDVISILINAGIISPDKADQARKLFPLPPQVGSSTVGVGDRGMMGSTTSPVYGNAPRFPQQGNNFGSSTHKVY